MEKKLFIGIDFSKEKFDVSVMHRDGLEKFEYHSFANTQEGCSNLLKWVKNGTDHPMETWLFCGENTGLYSVMLSEFLIKRGLFIWLENPLQIKQSTGIKREKNDKIDSRDIAMYAYRFQDKAKCYQLSDKALKSLELLLSFRERLIRTKNTLEVSSTEIRKVLQRDVTARFIYEESKKETDRLKKKIKAIEKRMMDIIQESESIKETYELVSSVKGIALINTVAIIVATRNFTCFENSRQFACYAGMAPFGKQSGSSLNTKPHVSHLANKKLKVLLTHAAKSAARHDINIKHYYERKRAEGKNDWVILNNIRNKMIHRIFAIVKNKQPYQIDYLNQLNRVA